MSELSKTERRYRTSRKTTQKNRLNEPPERKRRKDIPRRRRRCLNCDGLYAAKTGWQKFCSVKCKNDYQNHSGAYRKLKGEVVRLVEESIRRRLPALLDEKLKSPAFEKLLWRAISSFLNRDVSVGSYESQYVP